jgi:hypothetical protein
MARLDFDVQVRSKHTPFSGFPGVGQLSLRVWFGVAGQPQYRLNGGTWFNLPPQSGSYYIQFEVPELLIGLNSLEYRDDNGTRQLGRFRIYDIGEGCRYTRSTGIGNVQFPIDPSFYFSESQLQLSYAQVAGLNLQFSIYNDGITGFKGTNNIAIFSQSEIEAVYPDLVIGGAWVKNVGTGCAMQSGDDLWFKTIVAPLDPLQAVATVSNVTVSGGTDGSISVAVTGGSGSYTVVWADDPTTSLFRDNLPAGEYQVTITDTVTGEIVPLDITVEEPGQVIRIGTVFEVPMLNSLRFVVNPTVPDNVTTFQNTRNTLLRDTYYPGFECTNYYQKLIRQDAPLLQFWSDYPGHSVDLLDYRTNTIVKSFLITLKEQNVGLIDPYGITIRNHIGFPGQSRVYFNVGPFPIPFGVGEDFEILNNLDGFNGTYEAVDVIMDTTLNYPYIVINKNYTAPASTSAATGNFFVDNTDYNVYESVLNMNDVFPGEYYVRIAALDDLNNQAFGISEPIDLQEEHPDTLLLEYRNTDNAYDLTWTTGYIGMMRIPAILFEETTGGTRSVSRNADYSLQKINAKKTHIVTLNTYMLPPWMHVKLGVVFDLDSWSLNRVPYQTDEDYEKPKYIDQFKLANSSIDIEELNFFRKYNSRGISSVDGGFITQEKGFIRR